MSTPAFVFAAALHEFALGLRLRAGRFATALHPHREILTTLGIATVAHLSVLLLVGVSLYETGDDDSDVPELSVQIETREGPQSEEMSDAALPVPAPDPVEDVLDDPGTAADIVDAPLLADATPSAEHAPESLEEVTLAASFASAASGAVLTTAGASDFQVPEATAMQDAAPVSQPERAMLQKNLQKVAQQLLDTKMTDTEITWSEAGREYRARVMRQPAQDSTGLEQVIAEIMTESDGKRMKTRLSLKRLAFSHFTQLVNNWDTNIRLHNDVIEGRFHSNTQIGLAFSKGIEPRFFGKVTTAAASMTLDNFAMRRRKDVFQGGVETRTEKVALPREMPDIVNGGEPGDRHAFSVDTRIIFNPDGSFAWRAANGEGPLERADPSSRPRYLIAEKSAKLFVSGTVAGIFTVYTPLDIEIENDIVYAQDPRHTVMSRDFLALIAGRDIRIANARITGQGDLHVHAALFARRRFSIELVENSKPGTLYMLGSLTAGTIWETEPRYATRMDFDKRFEYLRPAAFPMTRRYEVDTWEQGWEEIPESAERLASEAVARSE